LRPGFISETFFSQALFLASVRFGKFPGQAAALFSFDQHVQGRLQRAASVKVTALKDPTVKLG
jgi:hypothetical protein